MKKYWAVKSLVEAFKLFEKNLKQVSVNYAFSWSIVISIIIINIPNMHSNNIINYSHCIILFIFIIII